ncbi:MAG: aminotransferase [Gammaproteobacteria bacterium TMED1]|nr:MAG: aminotransferase [Gammaproteobacteria bacterium TMED1]|tara:strand:+ start:9225 stop:10481 length:1257 start_codon:yes stop_codon:yes gene_type:complete
MGINDLSITQLESKKTELEKRYSSLQAENLVLDLTRGKPSSEQLDLSNKLDGILEDFFLLQDGTDVRNYGGIRGIPEARTIGAVFFDVDPESVMVGGNSSLTMMYHYLAHMMPLWRSETEIVKFICVTPGYDRHFTICEKLNIEMVSVGFNETGPDMETVFSMVENDSSIKGIWCVPKYSNPTGHTYSKKTVERFSELGKIAGTNFRIIWDNAYAVHHLGGSPDKLENIKEACEKEGTLDSMIMFASTSKVTFAGSGISFVGSSQKNLDNFEQYLSAQTIGFDKVNQLRHARFLKNEEEINAHMEKHREIIQPKFAIVEEKLTTSLAGMDIASWTKPNGGYFVSLDTTFKVADQVIKLADKSGVKLTPAGATFPYGNDPNNSNIRIAPTFPPLDELEKAMDVLVLCIELATVNYLLNK